MSKISTKTIARIAAVQALYQYQINGSLQKPAELVLDIVSHYKDSELPDDLELGSGNNSRIKLNINYFSALLQHALNDLPNIDIIIEEHLAEGWKPDTLHTSLIALLRAAITELRYFPEVPYKVVINEFTDIASDLLKENEVAFVNSLLDTVSKKFREASIK